jgi:hypothetical protein
VPLPGSWKNYPDKKYIFNGYLTGFPHEDKKYLRVYFEVLERFPREKFRHDERQIEVLEDIRDRMPDNKGNQSGATQSSSQGQSGGSSKGGYQIT